MSQLKYQNQYPRIWMILKEIKFYQNNDTQKSGRNSQKMIPKNLGIAQKGTQKSGSKPKKKVPKIMAHPRITYIYIYISHTTYIYINIYIHIYHICKLSPRGFNVASFL